MYIVRLEVKIGDYTLVKHIIDIMKDTLEEENLHQFSIELEAEG